MRKDLVRRIEKLEKALEQRKADLSRMDKLHILKVSYEYAAWLTENKQEDSLHTFLKVYCFEGIDGEFVEETYKRIGKVFAAAGE